MDMSDFDGLYQAWEQDQNVETISSTQTIHLYLHVFLLVGQTSCYLLIFFSPGHGLHVQLQGAQVADAEVVNGSSEGLQHRGQRHRAWRCLGVVGVGAMMHFRVAGQAHASGPILGTRSSEFGFSSVRSDVMT